MKYVVERTRSCTRCDEVAGECSPALKKLFAMTMMWFVGNRRQMIDEKLVRTQRVKKPRHMD